MGSGRSEDSVTGDTNHGDGRRSRGVDHTAECGGLFDANGEYLCAVLPEDGAAPREAVLGNYQPARFGTPAPGGQAT